MTLVSWLTQVRVAVAMSPARSAALTRVPEPVFSRTSSMHRLESADTLEPLQ